MNGKVLRAKKNLQSGVNSYGREKLPMNSNVKQAGGENLKGVVACPPKEKPDIPKHYLETIRKKGSHRKSNLHDNHSAVNDCENNCHSSNRMVISIRTSKSDLSRKQFKQQRSSNEGQSRRENTEASDQQQKSNRFQERNLLGRRKSRQTRNTIHDHDLSCKQIVIRKLRKFNQTQSRENCPYSFSESHSFQPVNDFGFHLQGHGNSQLVRNRHDYVDSKTSKSFSEQISNFQERIKQIESMAESETFKYLQKKSNIHYRTKNYSSYLEKHQPRVGWFKRAIIINWMIEVSQELGCSREALATAVCLLDSYLSQSAPIVLGELQLIACGALSLGNKIDGIRFDLRTLSEETESIGVDEIVAMEQAISVKLCWKLNPPTLNMWANRIALQWDMYLQSQASLPPSFQANLLEIQFKSKFGENYFNLRTLLQYIDIAMMQVHSLRYNSHMIAASFIYIILTINLKAHAIEQVIEKFPNSSKYLLEETELNCFYCEFLHFTFGFSLNQLLPDIQYCSTFCILPLSYDLPPAVHCDSEKVMTLEEFYSYQTHNPNCLACLRRRDNSKD